MQRISLFWKLAAVLVAVPLLDLGAILWMSHYTGGWVTFGTVVVCGLLGAYLVRREGLRVWSTVRNEIAVGRIPETPLLDGVLVLVSGVLLMTPGPLTDALGLVLLLPPVRTALRTYIRGRVERMLVAGAVKVVSGHR